MSKATYNATLGYANDTIEFWYVDDAGDPVAFEAGTTFSIKRIDDPTKVYEWTGVSSGIDGIEFSITLGSAAVQSILRKDTDTTNEYSNVEYEHIYSVKSDSTVYLSGQLNLVEIA